VHARALEQVGCSPELLRIGGAVTELDTIQLPQTCTTSISAKRLPGGRRSVTLAGPFRGTEAGGRRR